jgi:tRNA A37 threonylcarbamoyladenosine synthetase subunit TsaC/SUA5/YrdC
VPSTIVDATGENLRVLRVGTIPVERLREIVEPLGVKIEDEE